MFSTKNTGEKRKYGISAEKKQIEPIEQWDPLAKESELSVQGSRKLNEIFKDLKKNTLYTGNTPVESTRQLAQLLGVHKNIIGNCLMENPSRIKENSRLKIIAAFEDLKENSRLTHQGVLALEELKSLFNETEKSINKRKSISNNEIPEETTSKNDKKPKTMLQKNDLNIEETAITWTQNPNLIFQVSNNREDLPFKIIADSILDENKVPITSIEQVANQIGISIQTVYTHTRNDIPFSVKTKKTILTHLESLRSLGQLTPNGVEALEKFKNSFPFVELIFNESELMNKIRNGIYDENKNLLTTLESQAKILKINSEQLKKLCGSNPYFTQKTKKTTFGILNILKSTGLLTPVAEEAFEQLKTVSPEITKNEQLFYKNNPRAKALDHERELFLTLFEGTLRGSIRIPRTEITSIKTSTLSSQMRGKTAISLATKKNTVAYFDNPQSKGVTLTPAAQEALMKIKDLLSQQLAENTKNAWDGKTNELGSENENSKEKTNEENTETSINKDSYDYEENLLPITNFPDYLRDQAPLELKFAQEDWKYNTPDPTYLSKDWFFNDPPEKTKDFSGSSLDLLNTFEASYKK